MIKEGPEEALRHKMLQSQMCTLLPVGCALHDTSGRLITGGLSAVPHKEASDRVVCDRRPFNSFEKRLGWGRLPHGSQLIRLVLPNGQSIRGSGDDLKSFLYTLRRLPSWLNRNLIGQPFSGKGFEAYGADSSKQ